MTTFAIIVTIVLLIVLSIRVVKYSYRGDPAKWFDVMSAVTVVSSLVAYALVFREAYMRNGAHVRIFLGILMALVVLQVMRGFLNALELKEDSQQSRKRANNIKEHSAELFTNVAVFGGMYVAVIAGPVNVMAVSACLFIGYSLSVFNVFRVMKYRLYDDLYLRHLESGGSYFGPTAEGVATLLQGLYNVLLRAYFFVGVSYGCVYALLQGDCSGDSAGCDFYVVHKTHAFVDFVYYSIVTMSTVGFGDICPMSVAAKIVSMSQIVVSYLFIGALLALIVGRYTRWGGGRSTKEEQNASEMSDTPAEKQSCPRDEISGVNGQLD